MRIAEIYHSIQGEGRLTGVESVFVRASGCNLRCWFCDTPFASWRPEGGDLSVDAIVAAVEEWNCENVVLTGGEPMLFAEMIPLTEQLARRGRHITIETAGTLYLPVTCHLMSISPKMANSAPSAQRHAHWRRRHERERVKLNVVRRLMREYDHQLKFVVDARDDLEEIDSYLREIDLPESRAVYLMPQGTDADDLAMRGDWLEPYCAARGYAFCPRRHIEWFGAVRGT